MPLKKNKIVFCIPPAYKSSASVETFLQGGSKFPSIGLLILAAIARHHGHEVIFKDFLNTNKDVRAALTDILDFGADWVAISATTDMIAQAAKLAAEIKRHKNHILVLIGGSHISALPIETMQYCPDFDIGFIGEAEKSFTEFVDSDLSGDSLSDIKGICFRDKGEIIVNKPQPFIEDLDTLPFPAWDLIEDMDLYRPAVTNFKKKPVFSIMTSRGCFGRCTFCDRAVFGNRVRMHSAGYVMKMIQCLRDNYNIREIAFYDDNMVFNKKRLRDICNLMRKEKKPLSWACNARVDLVDEEILVMMKEAGCWQISYGIESGSQEIIDKINKNITIPKVREIAELMKKIKLSMKGYFILGHPGENIATLKETEKLIMELPMDDIFVGYMTPYPGTEIYKNIPEYGTILKDDWSKLNSYEINFIPHGLTSKDMSDCFSHCYKAFYLRPRIIINYMKRIKNPLKIINLGIMYLKFQQTQRAV